MILVHLVSTHATVAAHQIPESENRINLTCILFNSPGIRRNNRRGMFRQLRRLHAFQHQHLAYLQSILDGVVIAEIGYWQEQGRPLTMKGLLLLELGAPATVRRRVQRLVRLGLVHKCKARHDGRVYHLEIDASVRRTYAKYLKLLSRL